jgi:hypothetical protein
MIIKPLDIIDCPICNNHLVHEAGIKRCLNKQEPKINWLGETTYDALHLAIDSHGITFFYAEKMANDQSNAPCLELFVNNDYKRRGFPDNKIINKNNELFAEIFDLNEYLRDLHPLNELAKQVNLYSDLESDGYFTLENIRSTYEKFRELCDRWLKLRAFY